MNLAANPHLALPAATCLAGWLMAVAGVKKNALEWRRRRRTCPSCGREASRACSCVK